MLTKDRLLSWLIAALLTLLGACADGGRTTGELRPAPGLANQLPSLHTDNLSSLPALPLMRGASDLTESSVDGDSTYARSGNAMPASPALQLAAEATELSWGIWELPASGELRYLDIDMTVPEQAGSVYIALADYQSGSWQLDGPVFSGRVLELDPDKHASPDNALYAAVIAYDKAEATVQKLSLLAGHSNTAPSAVLEAEVVSGNAPLAVELDASGSTDPDGNIARYLWDWDGDGLVDGTSYSAVLQHTYEAGGEFAATVTVEDADGASGTSTAVNINVNGQPTAVLSLADSEVQKGDIVVLNGSLSSDSDGSIVLYEWDTDGDGSFDADSGDSSTLNIGAGTAGPLLLQLRVTDDDGATAVDTALLNVRGWNTVNVNLFGGPDHGKHCSLALVNGFPAISYYRESTADLMYVRATDAEGSSWGNPIAVATPSDQGQFSSLLVVNGNPAIGFWEATNSNLRYVRSADPDGTVWAPSITVDAPGLTGSYLSMALVHDNPAMSYHDSALGLRFVRANDANGSDWGTPLSLDSVGITGGYTSLALLSTGYPAISYYDASNGDLRFIRATDQDGTAWVAPVTLDSLGDTGVNTSLALVNGNPAISYYDQGADNLRYIRAETFFGSIWGPPQTLDSIGDTGDYPSLEVINGFPAISYHDATSGKLRYIRATDANGQVWNPSLTLDNATSTGEYTSMCMIGGGRHAICYYDSNSGLRYAWEF
ncbi:MAG: PKD domain-containing protein [Planctomycetales bacterium]|nr:PKD domain-containing protein [bacterium]UNM07972.1 MAG: PKD domain-containing protein [Planctomycetales bacterium]